MTDADNEDAKIIVDEDWKSRVEREKEELRKQEKSLEKKPLEQSNTDQDRRDQIPPASFTVLLSTLATQAMAGLGIFPDPTTGKPTVDRPLAKHFIDTIGMLEVKTKGNLTDDEARQVEDALHQLRMVYLSTADSAKPDSAEPKKSTIELP